MADRHNYWQCRDEDCPRLACIAWREGYEAGYAAGAAAAGDE